MLQYLLMCKSLTYAQRAARLLARSGIPASITKVPQSAVESGCTYCIKIGDRHLPRALQILNSGNLGPSRIFLLTSGGVSEVPQ